MPYLSREQVERAREIDLLSYLKTYEPHELVRDGPNRYTTKSHGSLVISNGKWIWNQGRVGGVSALNYLINVRGMGFVDAVTALSGERAAAARLYQSAESAKPSPEKKPFILPEPAKFAANAVAYLQKRGVCPEVIGKCLESGLIYESKKFANVVFVGKDDTGEARFACMRGTKDDFKIDVAGSDKRHSFRLPAKNPNSAHLAVFEAPIDALSHTTLQRRNGWDFDMHRLSLGGVANIALIAFLERNPQILRVVLHLDNDTAGITAARKIKSTLAADSRWRHIRVSVNPPRRGKDYNEALLHDINREREQRQNHTSARRSEAR